MSFFDDDDIHNSQGGWADYDDDENPRPRRSPVNEWGELIEEDEDYGTDIGGEVDLEDLEGGIAPEDDDIDMPGKAILEEDEVEGEDEEHEEDEESE